jgi:CubicO group peptidase (beta-lactamase class C family)
LRAVDRAFERLSFTERSPGWRTGRHRRDLVHARGLGTLHHGGTRPDADSVFRIASMTKSFSAAAGRCP